jgi:hypothetical protein
VPLPAYCGQHTHAPARRCIHITLLRTSPRALDAKSPNELSAHHLQPLQHQICPALYGIELAVFTGLNMTSDNFRLSNSLLRDMPLRVAHVGAPTLLTRTSSGPKATTAPAPKHPLPPRSIPAPASLRNTRSLNKWSEVAASTRRDLLLASVGTAVATGWSLGAAPALAFSPPPPGTILRHPDASDRYSVCGVQWQGSPTAYHSCTLHHADSPSYTIPTRAAGAV